MADPLDVERAASADAPALADLAAAQAQEQEACRPTGGAPVTAIEAASAIDAALFAPAPSEIGFVARRSAAVVGVGYVSTLFPGSRMRRAWFLKDLYVAAAARRRGVGARLVGHIGAEAEAAGVDRLELHVVPGNVAAERLYAGLGLARADRLVFRVDL